MFFFQGGGGGGGAGSSYIEPSATNPSIGTAAASASPSVTITAIASATTTGGSTSPPALSTGAVLNSGTVPETDGQITLSIANPNPVAATGTVSLSALLARASVARVSRSTIARGSFFVAAHSSTKLRLRLSKRTRRYFKSHRRLTAAAVLVLKANVVSKATDTTLVIKKPKARRHDLAREAVARYVKSNTRWRTR
jgi:hypothetical protein